MTVTIYVDILICINLIINYYILSFSFKYVKCKASNLVLLRGAAAGAVLSLIILLPPMPVAVDLLLKLVTSAATVFASSLKKPIKIFLRLWAVFFGISFAMCGFTYFLCSTFLSNYLLIQNGVIYAEISPLLLILFTSAAYLTITVLQRISPKSLPQSYYCNVEITIDGVTQSFFGKIDSGNTLKEPFSQSPVIIVNSPDILKSVPRERIRQIPYEVIGSRGLLEGTKADCVKIDGITVPVDIYVSANKDTLYNCGIDAILCADLLCCIQDYCKSEEKTNESDANNKKRHFKDKTALFK
ncbi:MAG: sigma-E processing peptidase SpoIIGA [Clostridiales bacterium]|nr:sigma-E processing peptidase SpoIIGA [Clostridiales bacterium]